MHVRKSAIQNSSSVMKIVALVENTSNEPPMRTDVICTYNNMPVTYTDRHRSCASAETSDSHGATYLTAAINTGDMMSM